MAFFSKWNNIYFTLKWLVLFMKPQQASSFSTTLISQVDTWGIGVIFFSHLTDILSFFALLNDEQLRFWCSHKHVFFLATLSNPVILSHFLGLDSHWKNNRYPISLSKGTSANEVFTSCHYVRNSVPSHSFFHSKTVNPTRSKFA